MPYRPKRPSSVAKSMRRRSAIVCTSRCFSFSSVTLPTPGRRSTGSGNKNESISSGCMTKSPSGFFQSEAIFARNLLGVAPNKFLAKIASDWKKPDGLFVIQPEEIDSFLLPLPVDRLPGVGKVTDEKLKHLEVQTIADLRRMDLATLEGRFGRYGVRLYELAQGIDNSEVVPDRSTQSI